MRKKSPSLTTVCFLFWISLALLSPLPLLGHNTAHAADVDSVTEKIGSILNKGKDKASDLLEKGGQLGKELLEEGKVLRDDAVRKGDELLDSLDKSLDGKPKETDKGGNRDTSPDIPLQNVADKVTEDTADKPAASTADKPGADTADKPAASTADKPGAGTAAESATPK